MSEPSGDRQSVPLSTRLFALLKTLQVAIIVLTLFYVGLGELLRRNRIADVSGMLLIISGCATAESLAVVYLKSAKIAGVEPVLRDDPEDRAGLTAMRKWYAVALALCAGVSMYGFVMRIMGATFWLASIFYVSGIALALYCSPRKPE